MVLVLVAVAVVMLWMRTQPQQATEAVKEQQKAATPTQSPTTGTQSVARPSDFESLMANINKALDITNNIIQTQTQKN